MEDATIHQGRQQQQPPAYDSDTAYESDSQTQYASIVPPTANQRMEPARRSSEAHAYDNTQQNQLPDTAREIKEGKAHGQTQQNYKLVEFAENDPENPKNWSKARKWWITMMVALLCFVVAFASSVITADVGAVAEEFNVSREAALVPISVFVVGFGVGPMIFAPLSEVYGRQII